MGVSGDGCGCVCMCGGLISLVHVYMVNIFTAYCTSVLFGKEEGVLKFLRESATLEEVCRNPLTSFLTVHQQSFKSKYSQKLFIIYCIIWHHISIM